MKKINFKKIDLFVLNTKDETISKIDDLVVYTEWSDGKYPTVNYKGFTICKFKNGDFRTNRIGCLSPAKHKTIKDAINRIENYGKMSFNVLDIIS